jgi:hypothetical protein
LLWFRDGISRRVGWPAVHGDPAAFVSKARKVLIILTALPIIVLTICPALLALAPVVLSNAIRGIFSLPDANFSFGIPLVLVALVMIGFALRERQPEFTFYAGALFNLAVTLAFLLAVSTANAPFNKATLVRLVQLNALTFAVYSLPWLSIRRRWQSVLTESDRRFADYLIKLQLGLAIVLNLALILPTFELVRVPASAGG